MQHTMTQRELDERYLRKEVFNVHNATVKETLIEIVRKLDKLSGNLSETRKEMGERLARLEVGDENRSKASSRSLTHWGLGLGCLQIAIAIVLHFWK